MHMVAQTNGFDGSHFSTLDTTVSLPTINVLPSEPGLPTVTGHTDADPTTATISWTPPTQQGAGLTQRQVQVDDNADFTSPIIDGTASWGTSINVSGLPKGTSLNTRVRAATAAGFGPWSATRNFTTGTTVPGIPTGVDAVASGTSITVTWDAPTDNGGSALTGYRVQRATNAGFTTGVVAVDVSATPRSYQVTGLAHGTQYWFRVLAKNSTGDSSFSTSDSATTGITTPSAPAQPTASNIGPTTATVTWSASGIDNGGSALTGYEVQRATNASFTGATQTGVGAGTLSINYSGLTPGTDYWVRVRAVNAAGSGDWSPSRTFKTLSGVKVGDGAVWKDALVWVGNGTAWVLALVKSGDGSAWK
jgi:hypothetical protein